MKGWRNAVVAVVFVAGFAAARPAQAGYLEDAGWGSLTVLSNVVYMPAKIVYATLGGLTGGLAFPLTAAGDAIVAGRTVVAPITALPAADLEPRNAAEVRDVPADDPDRAGTFALRAAGEALAHADLDGVGRGRMGVALGTTLGGMRLFE